MLSLIASDLHLGTAGGGDVARYEEARERLVAAARDADQLVLLGDVLELRERPVARVLDLAKPLFRALGEATAGRRVVLVPGNHDHQLAEPWLTRVRLDGGHLPIESVWGVKPADGVAGRLAEWMPRTEVVLAYPGVRLRPDVYVTHGHYLDLHLSVPRLESIAASGMALIAGKTRRCASPSDYEAVVAPLYAFLYGLAQGGTARPLRGGSRVSRKVWRRVTVRDRRRLRAFLLGRVTIPGAVALLNRAGLGPFGPNISGPELRRAGLRAIAAVVKALAIDADHVIFGHTHRAGPLAGDREGWTLDGGTRLWNSGTWLHEPVLIQDGDRRSPYLPGTVIRLGDEGPPELLNLLEDLEVPASAAP